MKTLEEGDRGQTDCAAKYPLAGEVGASLSLARARHSLTGEALPRATHGTVTSPRRRSTHHDPGLTLITRRLLLHHMCASCCLSSFIYVYVCLNLLNVTSVWLSQLTTRYLTFRCISHKKCMPCARNNNGVVGTYVKYSLSTIE